MPFSSLLNLYFLSVFSNLWVLFAAVPALGVLLIIVVASGSLVLFGRSRRTPQRSSPEVVRLARVAGGTLLFSILAVWLQAGVFPFDDLDSTTSFILVSVCAVH